MPKAAIKQSLTERLLRSLKPREGRTYLVWDADTRGLVVAVQPNGSGRNPSQFSDSPPLVNVAPSMRGRCSGGSILG